MTKRTAPLFLMVLTLLLLVGCSGSGPTPPATPASQGAALFEQTGCIACHTVEAGQAPGIGPPMAGIVARSSETIQSAAYTGQADTVEAYLRESIIKPDVYLVDGYEPLMPQTYNRIISPEDMDIMIAYLLELQ